jgi:RNA polymerase sigma-70 factor (ECF subfamily)
MQHDEILKLLRERIVAFAASRTMGEMAEDLAQEVLVVLHEKYPSVGELTELVPLALKIMRYKMGEAQRKARRRAEYNRVPIEEVLVADPGDDPAGELLRRERLERLSAALDQLTPRCRQLFRWKLEGKRFEEIRELLGADSINTIYTWDFRCRKQLLDLLGGTWE